MDKENKKSRLGSIIANAALLLPKHGIILITVDKENGDADILSNIKTKESVKDIVEDIAKSI